MLDSVFGISSVARAFPIGFDRERRLFQMLICSNHSLKVTHLLGGFRREQSNLT